MAGYYPTFTEEELSNEIWKPVVGFEGYYSVSSLGRVRRDRQTEGARGGRILKPALRTGYPFVTLCVKNIKHNAHIHAIEARAFFGEPPACEHGRIEVNHRDGCRTNNRLENLEYCTSSENKYHAVSLGLMPSGDNHYLRKNPEKSLISEWVKNHPERLHRGENHHSSKITDEIVREMRRQYVPGKYGTGCRALAKKYGLNRDTVYAILIRRTWTHLE